MLFIFAEFQKLRFRQIRMRFHLNHGRLDSCGFVDRQQFVQADVRQSDGPASAAVHKTLHRPPNLEQSHAVVVKDIAVLIPRILVVPRLKSKGCVTEIEIQIVDSKSVPTRLESWFDAFRPMIGVPQLCGNKDVFTGIWPAPWLSGILFV